MAKTTKAWAEELLTRADVQINGTRPWDMVVHNEKLFDRVARQGSLGLGEAYMDGWWDAEALDVFFYKVLVVQLGDAIGWSWPLAVTLLKNVVVNLQEPTGALKVATEHYDIGNNLYEAMLDKRLTYTGGYWKEATNLDEAQEAKLDLVCKKIGLKAGQHVLDIGCGWGSFLKFAAEKYGARGTGVTISKEQVALAQKLCQGLPVEIQLKDYRDVTGTFDHVVSLGMFEHVGSKNYRVYMEMAARSLKDDGLFLVQSIGSKRSVRATDPWMVKYIFPNSMLPSVADVGKSIERLFIMEDWHNFGADYDKTLMAWHTNFETHWSTLKDHYGERFYRMWRYYLLSLAGAFRARNIQLWQIVFSKRGVPGGYTSIR